jgi:hypothetical protein
MDCPIDGSKSKLTFLGVILEIWGQIFEKVTMVEQISILHDI